MSGITELFPHIPKLCSSCVFAAAATIFYKKTFREDHLPIVGSLTVLGLFLDQITNYPLYSCVGASAISIFMSYTSYRHREWLKTAVKLDFYCTFLLAILDARFGLGGATGLAIPYWTNIRIFAAALPQFLRKPIWLKTKLQDLRSKLGPIYILFISSYVMSRDVNEMQWLQRLGNFAMFSSLLAGVCFRPDNSAVLDFVRQCKTKLSERRYYHGRLMLCSLGSFVLVSAADIICNKTGCAIS